MKKQIHHLILLSALLLAIPVTPSPAQMISSGGETFDTTGKVTAPGSAVDYDFIGVSAALTNFSVTLNQNTIGSAFTYATAPDGTYLQTGVEYSTTGTPAGGLVSFTLNSGSTLTSFDVYVLVNNVNNGNNFSADSVTLTSSLFGTPVSTDTQTLSGQFPSSGSGTVNDYVKFTVTGATNLDTFELSTANMTGSQEAIGAVTFAAATVPEPSSYALFAAGLGGFLFFARRRLV